MFIVRVDLIVNLLQ